MAVYKTFVLPHVLYGLEIWNCTLEHEQMLEVAHNTCTRRMLRVWPGDRHSSEYLCSVCGLPSMHLLLAQYRLRWAGHVYRTPSRQAPGVLMPRQGCTAMPPLGARPPRGRPQQSFEHTLLSTLEHVSIGASSLGQLKELAVDRTRYCTLLKGAAWGPKQPRRPTRQLPLRSCRPVRGQLTS